MSERSGEGRSTAHREVVETGERSIFWKNIRTQLKIASAEDIGGDGPSDTPGKQPTLMSHPPPQALPISTKGWSRRHLFQLSPS